MISSDVVYLKNASCFAGLQLLMWRKLPIQHTWNYFIDVLGAYHFCW